MYLWRKCANPKWLRRCEENLQLRFGPALAIVERPENARTLIEISCSTRNEAVALQREFGGTTEKLRADWLEQFTKRSRVKPVRIGTRQIVIPAEAAFGSVECLGFNGREAGGQDRRIVHIGPAGKLKQLPTTPSTQSTVL